MRSALFGMVENGDVTLAIMRYDDYERSVRLGEEVLLSIINGPGALIAMEPEVFDGWLAHVNEWWGEHRAEALRRKSDRITP